MTRSKAASKGARRASCEPICTARPTGSIPRKRERPGVERRHVSVVDPELVAAPAGGDLVVGVGIHAGVHAERDPRQRAARLGGCVEGVELGGRFHVELPDPQAERPVHLVARLAGPGEHQPVGRDAGGERAAQLAARDDVGAGAEAGARCGSRRERRCS